MENQVNKVGRPKKYETEEERKEAKKYSNLRPEEILRRKEYYKKNYVPKNPDCHNGSIDCICGGHYKILSQHLKTKKHINYFENLVNNSFNE